MKAQFCCVSLISVTGKYGVVQVGTTYTLAVDVEVGQLAELQELLPELRAFDILTYAANVATAGWGSLLRCGGARLATVVVVTHRRPLVA